jgi:hypothetical protein
LNVFLVYIPSKINLTQALPTLEIPNPTHYWRRKDGCRLGWVGFCSYNTQPNPTYTYLPACHKVSQLSPGLVITCRQMRSEARLLWYSSSTFCSTSRHHIERFTLPVSAEHIQEIRSVCLPSLMMRHLRHWFSIHATVLMELVRFPTVEELHLDGKTAFHTLRQGLRQDFIVNGRAVKIIFGD